MLSQDSLSFTQEAFLTFLETQSWSLKGHGKHLTARHMRTAPSVQQSAAVGCI